MNTKTNLTVKLIGEDGNAFYILGKVVNEMKKNGYTNLVDEFLKEAKSSDYNHLLATVMEYVNIE